MTTFDKYLRTTLEQAGHEAQEDGSSTVEAQHLLLAMAAQSDTEASQFLKSAGLDHGALRAALEREFAHGLSHAGVSLEASHQARQRQAQRASVPLGTSIHHAMQRGLEGLRGAPRPGHLLLGVLEAEIGTVPRALALAGIDRVELTTSLRQALSRIIE